MSGVTFLKGKTMKEVEYSDVWMMLLSTIRYSMGRMSYMPEACVELYQKYKGALTVNQIEQIKDEINEEIRKVECVGKTLGMQCDHDTWKKLSHIIHIDLYG